MTDDQRGGGVLLWTAAAVVGSVVLLAGLGVVLVVTLRGGDDAPAAAEPAAPDGAAVAEQACREKLLAELKAPATARVEVTSSEPFAGYHDLAGTVDSENGFGALIRNEWECRSVVVDGAVGLSIDEGLAVIACEDAVKSRLREEPVRHSHEQVTVISGGWKVTGEAHFDPDSDDEWGWQQWACEVIPDREKAFEGRMRVTGTGVGE